MSCGALCGVPLRQLGAALWMEIPAEQAAVLQKQCKAGRERERERELTFVGKREDTQVSEFSHRLSLFLCWWKLLVAALREAALLENNFLLYSNLAEIIPLRN